MYFLEVINVSNNIAIYCYKTHGSSNDKTDQCMKTNFELVFHKENNSYIILIQISLKFNHVTHILNFYTVKSSKASMQYKIHHNRSTDKRFLNITFFY